MYFVKFGNDAQCTIHSVEIPSQRDGKAFQFLFGINSGGEDAYKCKVCQGKLTADAAVS